MYTQKVSRVCSPPEVDKIWLWVYYNKIPIYPIFYLLKGDYEPSTVNLISDLLKGDYIICIISSAINSTSPFIANPSRHCLFHILGSSRV